MWIISREKPEIIHHVDNYLDDVFGVAESESLAQNYMNHVLDLCSSLGIQVNHTKVAGPARKLEILGFQYLRIRFFNHQFLFVWLSSTSHPVVIESLVP